MLINVEIGYNILVKVNLYIFRRREEMKNKKIGVKLIISFLSIALFIGILGYMSLNQLRTMNNDQKESYEILDDIISIQNLKQNLSEVRGDVMGLVYKKNDKDKQYYLENYGNAYI